MHPRLALPLLMLLGLALRLPWLARRPLWLDEALQHHVSSGRGVGDVITRSLAEDLHPPLFSILAAGVLQVVPGEAGLRLLPLLAGVAAIGVAYQAGRSWFDARAGLALALLVATCPPWVAWSREGRPYAVALLALTALLWAAGAVRAEPRRWPWLVAAAVVAVPWHYGAWPVVAGILVGLALEPRSRRAAGIAAVSATLAALPLAAMLLRQAALRGDNPHLQAWTGAGAVSGLPWALGWLASGSSSPWAALLGLAVLAALAWLARAAKDPVLVAVAGLPVALIAAAALTGTYPLGPVRHALVLLPGLLLLAAVAARLRQGALALVVLAVFQAGFGLARAPGLPVEDVPALLAALQAERQGEPVWVHPRLGYAARHYGLPEPATYGAWGEDPPDTGWLLLPAEPGGPAGALEVVGARAVRLP